MWLGQTPEKFYLGERGKKAGTWAYPVEEYQKNRGHPRKDEESGKIFIYFIREMNEGSKGGGFVARGHQGRRRVGLVASIREHTKAENTCDQRPLSASRWGDLSRYIT